MEGFLGTGQTLTLAMRNWRRTILALLVTLAVASPALTCINSESLELKLLISSGKLEYAKRTVQQIEADYSKEPNFEHTNDLAVARILFGRYDEAIELLKNLDRKYPNKSVTAANLGTAYELLGRDEEALRWIEEGVRRDPGEHYGTEWLHVRILRAKLAMRREPGWLRHNHVLGVSFGTGDRPVAPLALPVDHLGKPHSLSDAAHALSYQLEERTLLVKPPDATVADMHMARADLEVLAYAPGQDQVLDRGTWHYEEAIRYGSPDTDLIRRRMAGDADGAPRKPELRKP
jgi:tetratricopeptide (TPR) repeat protein